jgi:hypothetical protein
MEKITQKKVLSSRLVSEANVEGIAPLAEAAAPGRQVDVAGAGAELDRVVEQLGVEHGLESILLNSFGRNLRTKTN